MMTIGQKNLLDKLVAEFERPTSDIARYREALSTIYVNCMRCSPEQHVQLISAIGFIARGVLEGKTMLEGFNDHEAALSTNSLKEA
jgi:hypothetical protein